MPLGPLGGAHIFRGPRFSREKKTLITLAAPAPGPLWPRCQGFGPWPLPGHRPPPSLPLAPSRPWPLAAPAPGAPDRCREGTCWLEILFRPGFQGSLGHPLPRLASALAKGLAGPLQPALRPRQRWELRAPALNPKREYFGW